MSVEANAPNEVSSSVADFFSIIFSPLTAISRTEAKNINLTRVFVRLLQESWSLVQMLEGSKVLWTSLSLSTSD